MCLGTSKAGITWPCPSIQAANFDTEIAAELGDAIGAEAVAMVAGSCPASPLSSEVGEGGQGFEAQM